MQNDSIVSTLNRQSELLLEVISVGDQITGLLDQEYDFSELESLQQKRDALFEDLLTTKLPDDMTVEDLIAGEYTPTQQETASVVSTQMRRVLAQNKVLTERYEEYAELALKRLAGANYALKFAKEYSRRYPRVLGAMLDEVK